MIYKYEVLNPKRDYNKPYVDKHGALIIPRINKRYKYYVEAACINPITHFRQYVLLLGETKFDECCNKCRIDDYCRLKIYVKGEIKDYIYNELKTRPNINIEYLESEDNYDVYIVE